MFVCVQHMIYNTPTGGYLGQKLKNMIMTRQKLSKASNNPVPADFTAAEKDKLEADMDYLKSTIVNSENLDQIKDKMIGTMAHRIHIMKDHRMDIKESFPFLFASVDLVSLSAINYLFSFFEQISVMRASFFLCFRQISFDFTQRFPHAKHNALVQNWKSISSVLHAHLKDHHKVKLITEWCEEIHDILVLLRLLPIKTVGRNLGTIASFERAVDKLFIFQEVRYFYDPIKLNFQCELIFSILFIR